MEFLGSEPVDATTNLKKLCFASATSKPYLKANRKFGNLQ